MLVSHCRESGGGLWFDDADTFDAALDLLLDDPALRRRMARAGSEYALGEYSWDEVRRRFTAALAEWS